MSRAISAASVQNALAFLDEFAEEAPVDQVERLAARAIQNPRAVATLAVLLASMAEQGGLNTLATLPPTSSPRRPCWRYEKRTDGTTAARATRG
jgi:hypothetical protein